MQCSNDKNWQVSGGLQGSAGTDICDIAKLDLDFPKTGI